MLLKKEHALVLCGALSAGQALASDQSSANGFVEDSHLDLFLRNGYMNRDFKHGSEDKAEWGQSASAYFDSGFTQGTVGVGVDAFALYAVRLDGGQGRSGAGGIDFFKQGDSGEAAEDVAKLGAAVKLRVSNTVLKYGDQMPFLPVLHADGGIGHGQQTRLLPESYTGTLITSRELEGLQLDVGRFTRQSRKSTSGHDSAELDRIDVIGGSYQFSPNLSAAYYASDVEDVLTRQYVNLTRSFALADQQSLTLDFNGYKTRLDRDYALVAYGDEQARDNKIWSLAATYQLGAHSFIVAHQRNSGDIGYPYNGYQNLGGIGDGGNTIHVANSFWSDFSGKDERSWQLGYGLDFSSYGIPGLNYRFAYIRGSNIDAGQGRGEEREIFNQLQYVVQTGAAKDLSFRLRSSMLRTSNNIRAYNDDGNEIRAFVDYPINLL